MRKSSPYIQIIRSDCLLFDWIVSVYHIMFLKDSQVSILPKYTSNDLGGASYKYTSNQIGGKRKSKKTRKQKRKTQKRKTQKRSKTGGKSKK